MPPMKPAAALASLLMLAACASPTWTNPNVTPEQAKNDYSECNAMAQDANARDAAIQQDILASRGQDWQRSGTLGTHQDVFAAETQQRTGDIVRNCMLAKGYTPAK